MIQYIQIFLLVQQITHSRSGQFPAEISNRPCLTRCLPSDLIPLSAKENSPCHRPKCLYLEPFSENYDKWSYIPEDRSGTPAWTLGNNAVTQNLHPHIISHFSDVFVTCEQGYTWLLQKEKVIRSTSFTRALGRYC